MTDQQRHPSGPAPGDELDSLLRRWHESAIGREA
jgi:hypothetical protein